MTIHKSSILSQRSGLSCIFVSVFRKTFLLPAAGEVKYVEFYSKDCDSRPHFSYKKLEKTLFFEYMESQEPFLHERLMIVTFNTPMEEAENINFRKHVLKPGIFCSPNYYHFLGHSDSQLREKTCYLMNASQDRIRYHLEKFGDFDIIEDPSLRAKKIGFFFSPFQQLVELGEGNYTVHKDIKRGIFERHTFTDGCGFMSQQFVSKIANQLAEVNYPEPSVVLVRYQGFEGMLVLKKEGTKLAKGPASRDESTNAFESQEAVRNDPYQVQFHKSMKKSDIPDQTMRQSLSFMCIVDHSKPSIITYLDEKLIMLLVARGVSVAYLKNLQERYYRQLKRMCDDSSSADYFLRLTGRSNRTNEDLPAIRQDEIKKMIDPPRHPVARIRILAPNTRVVFGVCDPYKKLKYGECYFKPTLLHEDEENFAAENEVVVARSPCFHPGDLRVLKLARGKPEYKHLKDCLVLPVRGKCPHAFECAGGDVGGSKFFVSWDANLIPKGNIEACSFLPTKRENISRLVSYLKSKCQRRSRKERKETVEELVDYFAGFTDDLPSQIDETYMKLAKGPGLSPCQCEQLSKMFYQAVNSTVSKDLLQEKLSKFEEKSSRKSSSSAEETPTETSGHLNVDIESDNEEETQTERSGLLKKDIKGKDKEMDVEVRTNSGGAFDRFLHRICSLRSKDPAFYLRAEVLQEFKERATRFLEEARENHYIE